MKTETMNYDNIFAGNVMAVVTEAGIVAENQNIQALAIVEIDASGNVIAPGEVVDGTKAYAIAAEEVVTGAGETIPIVLYMTGEFNESKIVVPEGKTLKDYKPVLRKLGIFLKPVVRA